MAAVRQVTVQYFADCPNWRTTTRILERLADEVGFVLTVEAVESDEQARRVGFRGSPTVLVDGSDPFATGDEPVGLACRLYRTEAGPAGAPTEQQLRGVVIG